MEDFILDGDVLVGYEGSAPDVVIPPEVREIGEDAFSGNETVVNVIVPENVESIGVYAFEDCVNLKSIEMRNPEMEIQMLAFAGCTSLVDVKLPTSLETLPLGLFDECTSLKKIEIPSTVTVIEEAVFSNCTGLTDVVMPSSLEEIASRVFFGCSSLTSVPFLPNGLKYAAGTFDKCTSLKGENGMLIIDGCFCGLTEPLREVLIPFGTESIASRACSDFESIEKVVIPSSVKSIGGYAFSGCINLSLVEMGDVDVRIGAAAFLGCEKLVRDGYIIISDTVFGYCGNEAVVNIPEGVKILSDKCFSGNTSIREVTIPKSVNLICGQAFSETSLNKVTLECTDVDLKDDVFPSIDNFSEVITSTVIPEYVFRFNTLDALYSPLILHTNDINKLPKNYHCRMFRGFIKNIRDYSDAEVNMYMELIKNDYLTVVLPIADVAEKAFQFCIDYKLITEESYDFWLEMVTRTDDAQKIAMLLKYKKDNLNG